MSASSSPVRTPNTPRGYRRNEPLILRFMGQHGTYVPPGREVGYVTAGGAWTEDVAQASRFPNRETAHAYWVAHPELHDYAIATTPLAEVLAAKRVVGEREGRG